MTRQHKHRQKRRAEGLCAREGCPNKSGTRYLCEEHRAWHRRRMRKPKQEAAA